MSGIESFREMLINIGEERICRSHKMLIGYGERANSLFLVKSGGLVLNHIHEQTGKERAINFFIPEFHPIATISHSYVLEEPSKYTLKAFTKSTLIEVTKSNLNRALQDSNFANGFQEYGVKSLIDKNELRANLISLTSLEMLKHLSESYPMILRDVPSKFIADFLGVTPQWLSKLKHKL